jgi:hypothetical protein
VVITGSAVAVGSSLASGISEDSPAEKEDGGGDSSVLCEQLIVITVKPAIMAITANKTLAFLILCTAFHSFNFSQNKKMCNSAIQTTILFSAG